MIKIAVDMMGGDLGIIENKKAIKALLGENIDIEFYLVGDKGRLSEFANYPQCKIIHTDKYLDMGVEDPFAEFRKTPEHSLFKALTLLKKNQVDAVVSAGPTQAVVFGSHLIIGRLPKVRRLALAIPFNTVDGTKKILLDCGATAEISPKDLVDFSQIGVTYLKQLIGNNDFVPQVGLVSIGSEKGKGREFERSAYDLLKEIHEFNFYGNVEPKELFFKNADVLVTDGFSGNLILKSMEGALLGFKENFKKELKYCLLKKLAFLILKKSIKRAVKKLTANDTGGALILGTKGVVVKAHGAAKHQDLKQAIKQAKVFVENNIIEKFLKGLENDRWESLFNVNWC